MRRLLRLLALGLLVGAVPGCRAIADICAAALLDDHRWSRHDCHRPPPCRPDPCRR